MYARLFLEALVERYENQDEASAPWLYPYGLLCMLHSTCIALAKDLFGADGDVESLVRCVRGVQDGAKKFSAIGFKRWA